MNETDYVQGSNAEWRSILAEAIRHLGPEGTAEQWRLERADTVAALRTICDELGDNDWPDDLHLADVINKHLVRYLHDIL